MDDNGLNWEWTRAEFSKALLDCVTAAASDDYYGWLTEIYACSLLMLNFRYRLSTTQQKALQELAAVCDYARLELGRWSDPEEENEDDDDNDDDWNRSLLERVIEKAQESRPLFEGI